MQLGTFARHRRLRSTEAMRRLVRENELTPSHLIYPLFVEAGLSGRQPIPSMPGQDRLGLDALADEARDLARLGIGGVMLFGLPAAKDDLGSGAWAADGIVQQAIGRLKDAAPDLVIMADVCLCEYTSHGHCGPLSADGSVDNDAALPLLAETSVSLARAGADVIAPSDMMDGRVLAIRRALDAAGFATVPILSYAAKFASGFYGPFREAADSAPAFGDRRGYQMDPANARMALGEVFADLEQGADMVMVKPALPYLDIIRAVRERTTVPVAAYNVSGEYAMVMAAAQNGWIDLDRVVDETLTGIRRAGADIVITYHAKQWATRR
ncbi:porphobilinogen synthase [Tepidiforma thermophila]|uniref:Delta-aminolevulinic acid dehydratase n=1 Tax=Tepidiforma thermophila (strain KCTC 52669 / CGMCC 1.13589 / G233) TaxID=2761530 RepID=A0A2A9HHG9_TEPT2|nr:porphobilinogen synthase [Tepidiforma thermophila]PFG74582.1 porphobilinogen synthase [Tepidiforma thermophila]